MQHLIRILLSLRVRLAIFWATRRIQWIERRTGTPDWFARIDMAYRLARLLSDKERQATLNAWIARQAGEHTHGTYEH
jgi:hypothetical protein